MASIGGFPGQGPHPAIRLRVIGCICDHAPEDHDFDDGCNNGENGPEENQTPLGCPCEWYP